MFNFIVETIVGMCILDRKTTQFQADHDMQVPHSGQYFKMYYFLLTFFHAFWRGQVPYGA